MSDRYRVYLRTNRLPEWYPRVSMVAIVSCTLEKLCFPTKALSERVSNKCYMCVHEAFHLLFVE